MKFNIHIGGLLKHSYTFLIHDILVCIETHASVVILLLHALTIICMSLGAIYNYSIEMQALIAITVIATVGPKPEG